MRKFQEKNIPDDINELIKKTNNLFVDDKIVQDEQQNLTKIDELKNFFENDRNFWKEKLLSLSIKLKNLYDLPILLTELHSERQILLEYRYKLYERLAKLANRIKKKKLQIFEESKINYDHDLKYTNERTIYIDSKIGDIQEQYDLFKNHVQYLDETLKNFNDSIWSIKYLIDYEKIKSGI